MKVNGSSVPRVRQRRAVAAALLLLASALAAPAEAQRESAGASGAAPAPSMPRPPVGPAAVRAAGVAPAVDSSRLGGLRYRRIGPFRGGRSTAVAGIVGEPYTFYRSACRPWR